MPFRTSWRAGLGWSIAFVLMVVGTVAFWPAFQSSSGIMDALDQLPPGLLEAFGMEDVASPAGYLKGGLYDMVIPLMFAAAGVMLASSATAAEEDSGRLELWLTQPVTRPAVLSGRIVAMLGWLAVLALVTLVSQLASDPAFGLEIADERDRRHGRLCAPCSAGSTRASRSPSPASSAGRAPSSRSASGLALRRLHRRRPLPAQRRP